MNIFIDSNSPLAVYKQIKNQIKGLIIQSELPEGTVLPSIRTLAGYLEIANNTVARAYYELEEEGYLKLDGRRGSIVRKTQETDEIQRNDFLMNLTEEFLLRSREYGYTVEEIIAAIEDMYSRIY
ncbi:MAG: GntR family transcriptional regulator [candidate division WOR-3 bacterium]|nr:GntR family transcriptional regulator [candidate division WOR-3 bacterium]